VTDPELERLNEEISQLREDQRDVPLRKADLDPDPFLQFASWLEEALEVHKGWPNAVTLATASAAGEPSARTVLLKGIDHGGFVFFTNLESRKGREIAENPFAALVFYWPLQGRQVCVRGSIKSISDQESDEYFATRPRETQLGAWASQQSAVISDRAELDEALEAARLRFSGEVPRPAHWGGFRLLPNAFEFWKSRPNRLHDRFAYTELDEGWRIDRLAP
jgi:pyridoxamine 5'-phosphate oxidase